MPRSHPPTLLTLAERTLREECQLPRGARVLVAASGGGDSQALLHALSRLAPKLGFSLAACGVDHGLRSEAARELDLAEALVAELGIDFTRVRVQVSAGGNLQARARRARREALAASALRQHCAFIATAHHADDRAETVLIRMLRGAGPRGLAVLPAQSGVWLRPLLRVRKTDITLHLSRHGIAFAEDPSNRDARFLRARVRFELLPLLQSLSPQVVDHLCALADALGSGEASPVVHDPSGLPVTLSRAQTQALRRIRALGRPRARVLLAGGREIRLDPTTFQPQVVPSRLGLERRRGR